MHRISLHSEMAILYMEPICLNALRNPVAQAFMAPLNEILQHVMAIYGKINPSTFMARKNALETFQYQVLLLVDVVFDPIDNPARSVDVAVQPMIEA